MKIKWCGYIPNSMVNGKGIRDVIFLPGCVHNCPGCHNKKFQNPNFGVDIEIDEILTLFKNNNDMVDGITISGGDPLYQYDKTLELCKAIKSSDIANNNIWLYTGYTYDEIKERFKEILNYVDVIIDGKYDENLPKASFRGSNNQRIIDTKTGKDIKED